MILTLKLLLTLTKLNITNIVKIDIYHDKSKYPISHYVDNENLSYLKNRNVTCFYVWYRG